MEPKLLKTTIAEYVPAAWTGVNKSGASPTGDRVLVLPDKAAEQVRGVHIPIDIVARHSMAAEAGVIIEVGDGAFKWNSDKMTPFEGKRPQPGDRVCIEKYSGQLLRGDDDEVYRIMESSCIAAILTSEKDK